MVNEKDRLQALVNAGVATDEDKARLRELLGKEEEVPVAAAPVTSGEGIPWEADVDVDAFKRGGSQYYCPKEEGLQKTKLVDILRPDFTEKEQLWFIFETARGDGRGVVSAELTKGAFKLKDVLDGLAIKYTLDERTGKVKFNPGKLPLDCWADWGKDAKGLGGVKISGLKPASANIEQAM